MIPNSLHWQTLFIVWEFRIVGLSNAKLICKHFKEDFNAIREADAEDFIAIDQIGPMIAEAMVSYFIHHIIRRS